MKTWRRGRKPASPEQLSEARERQKLRVRITNIVTRDKDLERKCCICGKENSEILHNTDDPYFITFLCSECRKNKDNIDKAELHRFDLREYKQEQFEGRDNNFYINTRKLSKEEIKEIIDGFISPVSPFNLGEFAKAMEFSRYQFNQIIERYKEYYPEDTSVEERILDKSKSIQRKRLSIAAKGRQTTKELEQKPKNQDKN